MPRPPSSSSSCELPPRVAVSILHENARVCEEYFKRSGPSSNEDGMPIVRRTSQLPFDADSDSVAETCVAHGRSEECPRLQLMRTAAAICAENGRSLKCPWQCVQHYNEFMQQRRAAMQSQRLAASRVAERTKPESEPPSQRSRNERGLAATRARMNRESVGMSPRSAGSDEAERADSSELDDLDDAHSPQ